MLHPLLIVYSFVVMMLGGVFKSPGTVADCFDGWGEMRMSGHVSVAA